MSKHKNICLSEKNSTQQTTLFHETERPAFKNPFSWQTVADIALYYSYSYSLLQESGKEVHYE